MSGGTVGEEPGPQSTTRRDLKFRGQVVVFLVGTIYSTLFIFRQRGFLFRPSFLLLLSHFLLHKQ